MKLERFDKTMEISLVCSYLIVYKELGSLEVATSDPDIVLLTRMIELGQAPVDQPQLSFLMVNHYIVWLHIPGISNYRLTYHCNMYNL